MHDEYPHGDNEHQTYTIEKVEGDAIRGWTVTFDGCCCFGIPPTSPVVPTVNMAVRQYGRGFGFVVRGVFLDGRRVFYRTEREQREQDKHDSAVQEGRQREAFDRERADLDRRYEALPPIFRARIDKFRRNNPDFRWQFEGYELFTCEQAVVFADALKAPDALWVWHELPYKEQRAACPGMSDEHSGNTFGMACRLALDYLTKPENVEARHGALAPLVGSEEYGCVPKGDTQCLTT